MRLKVHGTYPFDSSGWRMVKKLSNTEVQELLELEQAPGDDEYLWINKGFVVIDMPQDEGIPEIAAALLEPFVGMLAHTGIPAGARAVYLHDGSYSLIEKVGKAECTSALTN